MVCGIVWAKHLDPLAANRLLTDALVFAVMLLMSVSLETRAMWRSMRRPGPALLATAISFVVVPILALAGGVLLSAELAAGLLVVGATPCTLASATVWTARARGNEATAMLTTIITNALCFAVTPLIVWLALGRTANLSPVEISMRLAVVVVLPIVVGQALRGWRALAFAATERKNLLGIAAQSGILVMVALGMASTWNRLPDSHHLSAGTTGLLGAICLVVHLVALQAGWFAARWLGMARAEQIAVALACSQKTLMVGLVICLYLEINPLPMVIYHAVQLLADTLIADRWARISFVVR